MNLILVPGILEQIIQHATAAYPNEGCGLLVGRGSAERFIPMKNILSSPAEFEMDPAELISVLRNLRGTGEQLIAIYHSHPHGPAENRKLEQFFFHHDRSALGNQRDLNRGIKIRHVIRHEDIAAGVVESVKPDSLNAHTGNPHASPRAPHKKTIENPDITHDVAGGKADQRGHRRCQRPEDQHEDGADHFPLSPVAEGAA